MNAFEQQKLVRLNGLLATLSTSSSTYVKASEFKAHFEEEEYRRYKSLLADNKVNATAASDGAMPLDAQEYWRGFQDVYLRAVRLRNLHDRPSGHTNKRERDLIESDVCDLVEQMQNMSPEGQSWFRPSEHTDRQWRYPGDVLEEDLPVLMSEAERVGMAGNVTNLTQRQFLHEVMHLLDPPPQLPHGMPEGVQRLRALTAHHNR